MKQSSKYYANFCTSHPVVALHWHLPDRIFENRSLIVETRLSNSVREFEIRDDVLEMIDFHVVLVEYCQSFSVYGRLKDADALSINT